MAVATGRVFTKFARPTTRVADDVSMQTVHAIHEYTGDQLRIDHHFEDTLRALDNGEFVIDMTRFDAVVPDPTTRDSVRA